MKNSLKFLLPFLVAALLMLGTVAIQAQQPQQAQSNNSTSASSKPTNSASSKTADKAGSSSATTPKPATQKQTPPATPTGTVWVNTDSGLYHKPGTRWYGKTKHGKYMTEADAQKAGYRPASKE